MNALEAIPTKRNVLERLAQTIPLSSIVDVGVRECTWELLKAFPDKRQYLFEPVGVFVKDIEKNYAQIDYQLHKMALSDIDTDEYLVLSSIERDSKVTHSQIVDKPVKVDGQFVVACEKILVRRFDSLELSGKIDSDFLLKVDVDGKDLNVIRGFGETLQKASAVIIECTFANLLERVGFLASSGFELVDLVDFCYYGPSLYQVDAVVVRKDLVTTELRPPIKQFERRLWKPLAL
jgi:FkbM family methyltransferase